MEKGDKIFFQKKIIYLDYVERENKIKNGGVIKWEARGGRKPCADTYQGTVSYGLLPGRAHAAFGRRKAHPADTIYLQYGTAEYVGIWHNENLAGTGIPYEGCDGIIIKLSETRFLRGIWRNREKQKAEAPKTAPQNEPEPAMHAAAQTAEEPMAVVQTMGPVSAAQTVLDAYDDTVLEPQPMPGNEEMRQDEPGVEVQPMPETEEPQQVEPEAEEQPEPQEPQQAIRLRRKKRSPMRRSQPPKPRSCAHSGKCRQGRFLQTNGSSLTASILKFSHSGTSGNIYPSPPAIL